jgi:hypothetical protein
MLVSSAACGADLIALDIAARASIPFRVVLPFGVRRFRETSVVDRPGNWGPQFDAAISEAKRRDALIVLRHKADDAEAYRDATARIVEEAARLAIDQNSFPAVPTAVAVWDGQSHGASDATELLLTLAEQRDWPIHEVSTL